MCLSGQGRFGMKKRTEPGTGPSFPLTLTDRWVGQARNCVVTFVYKTDSISNTCLQCSQETADVDDQQLGNISGTLATDFQSRSFTDSIQIIDRYGQAVSRRIPVRPLSEIDSKGKAANYLEKPKYTNAPTSLGAVLLNDTLYLHPPKTRHGLYPYPEEMRHGLYSVTKSMAGALALMYFEERYPEGVFNATHYRLCSGIGRPRRLAGSYLFACPEYGFRYSWRRRSRASV